MNRKYKAGQGGNARSCSAVAGWQHTKRTRLLWEDADFRMAVVGPDQASPMLVTRHKIHPAGIMGHSAVAPRSYSFAGPGGVASNEQMSPSPPQGATLAACATLKRAVGLPHLLGISRSSSLLTNPESEPLDHSPRHSFEKSLPASTPASLHILFPTT